MQRITGAEVDSMRPFFEAAARIAEDATCRRARCGTVIVNGGEIVSSGFNGPALGDESSRTCDAQYDLSLKPKYDKTCCIHAEWRAILNACKTNSQKLSGSTLYFMRINDQGEFTDAGEPYCTTCSRLTLEAGVDFFALWNDDGIDLYAAAEYNQTSYEFYRHTALDT